MVATMRGRPGHDIIERSLLALTNLEHRGATGADPLVGDGAGLLCQFPDRFFRDVVDFPLAETGHYAVGTAYVPTDPAERETMMLRIEEIVTEEGLEVLGW